MVRVGGWRACRQARPREGASGRGPLPSFLPAGSPRTRSLCAELLVTEASHLRTLRVLDVLFYQRLRKENLLSREELALLFPNLPELIEVHSKAPPLHSPLPAPRPPWPPGTVSPPSLAQTRCRRP